MKNLIFFLLIVIITCGHYSCTDIQGDGIDSVLWEGSQLPQETSFRNPVWEPDLAKPSVFRGATQFYAFGDEKEWSTGLNYTVPVLRSSNLMTWSFSGEAFVESPAWAEEPIRSVGGDFSKTLGTYFLFYTLGDAGIGVAYSKAPQGPYIDYGKLMDADTLGFESISEPFFIQSGLDFYLFLDTDQGIYGVELDIRRNSKPELDGAPFKIAGSDYTGFYVYRKNSGQYYCFATAGDDVSSEVYMGMASDIEGPYLDQSGTDLADNGGTLLIRAGDGNLAAPGHVGGVFSDKDENEWIMYQVTDTQNPQLSSGANRRPLMLNPIEWDENGWPLNVIEAREGWTSPRFVLN